MLPDWRCLSEWETVTEGIKRGAMYPRAPIANQWCCLNMKAMASHTVQRSLPNQHRNGMSPPCVSKDSALRTRDYLIYVYKCVQTHACMYTARCDTVRTAFQTGNVGATFSLALDPSSDIDVPSRIGGETQAAGFACFTFFCLQKSLCS